MAAPPNPVGTWAEYFDSVRDKPLHPLYQVLATHLPSTGSALELGAGVGTGARFLQDWGLIVTAVDAEPEAVAALREFLPPEQVIESLMQDVELREASYDVIVAGFCLFFLPKVQLAEFWPKLIQSLRPGGLLMAQFLGARDDWASAHTAQSTEELSSMVARFETLHFEEAERDGLTSQGTSKHWHVYHFVGRLP